MIRKKELVDGFIVYETPERARTALSPIFLIPEGMNEQIYFSCGVARCHVKSDFSETLKLEYLVLRTDMKQWRQIDKKVRELVGSLIAEAKIEKP